MNPVNRGVRNAFRNYTRTISIVIIIGISIGLGLSMLVARQAVTAKIASVKSSVGTTVSISAAGVRGFDGGGNPLTQTQLSGISKIDHVTAVNESLTDRLTSSNTNIKSGITAGSLGQRFLRNSGSSFPGGADNNPFANFTPPVSVLGTTDPTNLSSTIGGGTFKLTSGKAFSANSTENVAVIGNGIATANSLAVNSTFTAYGQTVTVIGIYDSGNTFSNNQVLMPLTTLQTLSGQPGDITSATVTVDSLDNVTTVTNEISKTLGTSADVTNQIQQANNTVTPLENIQTITLYSLIGALIAGAVIIFLIMIMIVRERRREIGVLKAIGASNVKVMYQFLTEAITLTLLGAVIGIIIGIAAAEPITKLLITNSTQSSTTQSVGGGGGGFRAFSSNGGGNVSLNPQANRGAFRGVRNTFSDVHAIVGWTIILDGIIAALIIALVGSAAASLLISKVRPSEVMRAE